MSTLLIPKPYTIIIAYDGTEYLGWQEQTDPRTIAGTLKRTFKHVFKRDISLVGASRTDAGVHAQGQVARFWSDVPFDLNICKEAWNNKLPQDIVIRSLEHSPEGFHPQHNVQEKTYFYHFFLERPTPFVQRYGWYYAYPVNLEKLQECLNIFVGTHDFRSFCSGDDSHNGTVRTITAAYVEFVPNMNAYRIVIKGPSFLRYMIRRIAGGCIETASRPFLTLDQLRATLERTDPHHLLPNAPAKGLTLHEIVYL